MTNDELIDSLREGCEYCEDAWSEVDVAATDRLMEEAADAFDAVCRERDEARAATEAAIAQRDELREHIRRIVDVNQQQNVAMVALADAIIDMVPDIVELAGELPDDVLTALEFFKSQTETLRAAVSVSQKPRKP